MIQASHTPLSVASHQGRTFVAYSTQAVVVASVSEEQQQHTVVHSGTSRFVHLRTDSQGVLHLLFDVGASIQKSLGGGLLFIYKGGATLMYGRSLDGRQWDLAPARDGLWPSLKAPGPLPAVLAMSALGRPHLALRSKGTLIHSEGTDSGWEHEEVAEKVGEEFGIALDNDGEPHIVYQQQDELMLGIRANNQWSHDTIVKKHKHFPCVAVDSAGTVHVVVQGLVKRQNLPLHFSRASGRKRWKKVQVTQDAHSGFDNQLCVDGHSPAPQLHLLHRTQNLQYGVDAEVRESALSCLSWNGEWTLDTPSFAQRNGRTSSLSGSPTGLAIGYSISGKSELILMLCSNAETSETIRVSLEAGEAVCERLHSVDQRLEHLAQERANSEAEDGRLVWERDLRGLVEKMYEEAQRAITSRWDVERHYLDFRRAWIKACAAATEQERFVSCDWIEQPWCEALRHRNASLHVANNSLYLVSTSSFDVFVHSGEDSGWHALETDRVGVNRRGRHHAIAVAPAGLIVVDDDELVQLVGTRWQRFGPLAEKLGKYSHMQTSYDNERETLLYWGGHTVGTTDGRVSNVSFSFHAGQWNRQTSQPPRDLNLSTDTSSSRGGPDGVMGPVRFQLLYDTALQQFVRFGFQTVSCSTDGQWQTRPMPPGTTKLLSQSNVWFVHDPTSGETLGLDLQDRLIVRFDLGGCTAIGRFHWPIGREHLINLTRPYCSWAFDASTRTVHAINMGFNNAAIRDGVGAWFRLPLGPAFDAAQELGPRTPWK